MVVHCETDRALLEGDGETGAMHVCAVGVADRNILPETGRCRIGAGRYYFVRPNIAFSIACLCPEPLNHVARCKTGIEGQNLLYLQNRAFAE
jgi:hypothetical protein